MSQTPTFILGIWGFKNSLGDPAVKRARLMGYNEPTPSVMLSKLPSFFPNIESLSCHLLMGGFLFFFFVPPLLLTKLITCWWYNSPWNKPHKKFPGISSSFLSVTSTPVGPKIPPLKFLGFFLKKIFGPPFPQFISFSGFFLGLPPPLGDFLSSVCHFLPKLHTANKKNVNLAFGGFWGVLFRNLAG